MEKIKLINHSSILITSQNEKVSILSDPWYDGFAFNNGWSLLYKNSKEDIKNILKKINFIFISHEHPDHFSIKFFIDFGDDIINNNIKILFQETRDKRVENFLKKKGYEIIILKNENTINLSEECKITLFKQGHIDSSLLLETENFYHLNMNDCEFLDRELNLIKKKIVNKDKKILIYIQFSYAAYRSSEKWLKEAASYKLNRIKKISNFFKSNLIVPFASFIHFCHSENFNLNKHINNCEKTSTYLNENDIEHCFLNPENDLIKVSELLENKEELRSCNNQSIEFWDKKFKNIKLINYEEEPNEILKENRDIFLKRINEKNNIYLLFILRYLSFKFFFGDVLIGINKTNKVYLVNFFQIKEIDFQKNVDINLSSDQFNFMLKEQFGFDTMLVSGRIKASNSKSLKKLATSLGFIAMNQADYGVKIKDIFNKFIFNKIQDTLVRLLLQKS